MPRRAIRNKREPGSTVSTGVAWRRITWPPRSGGSPSAVTTRPATEAPGRSFTVPRSATSFVVGERSHA